MRIKIQKNIIVVLVLFHVLALQKVFAFLSQDDAGTSSAQFLKLGVGARSSSMAESFCGVADDDTSIFYNPAGLVNVNTRSISFMQSVFIQDIAYSCFSFAKPKNKSVIGIGVQYLSYGQSKEMDEFGSELGSLNPNDFALTFSFAKKFNRIAAGLSLKYIQSKLKNTANAFAMDFGIFSKLGNSDTNIGVSVQNIGTKLKYVSVEETLPVIIKIGLSHSLQENWIVAGDLNIPSDNKLSISFGSEYLKKVSDKIDIIGRLGLTTKRLETNGLNFLTIGFGVNYIGVGFDYAYIPFGDLGDNHRLSLSYKF